MDDDARDMLVLGDLTVRTARFLDMVAGAYAFFAYGLSVPGVSMLASSISAHTGISNPIVSSLAALAGVVLGMLLSTLVPRRARAYAARVGGGRDRRLAVAFALVFAAGFTAGAYPLYHLGLEEVSWYGGLTLALALEALLLHAAGARTAAGSFLAAFTVAAIGLPLVAVLGDETAAVAMLMLAYLAGGSWTLWRASKLFE